ncbi:MAG TPA: molybdate ABC transporter substrate-binding protein [Granulicella sp.]|jgi:molybdate transport system substrate-binding protein|nr:molybdate ABC transporter substrate-binding protein [Granulicella sp.]
MSYRIPRILLLLVLGAFLIAPLGFAAAAQSSGKGGQKELRVDAAADLQTVLPALAQQYEQATGVRLRVSYGSSATLATQIVNGEPVDLFLSADYLFPEKVVAANLADTRDPIPYARGTLVLWARKDSPLQPLHLEALTDTRVKTVAIANAEHAPYGRAAMSALERLKLLDQVKPKLVVAENVAQAGQYVESGNAQVGLVSLTMAMSPHFSAIGSFVLVPREYPEIRQCAVVLAKSEKRTEAHAFLDWLRSPAIQESLPKLGLTPVL